MDCCINVMVSAPFSPSRFGPLKTLTITTFYHYVRLKPSHLLQREHLCPLWSRKSYQLGGNAVLRKLQDLFTSCWEKETLPRTPGMQPLFLSTKSREKIRLFVLSRHHPAIHCRQNLGSRLAQQAHPNDSTGKHAKKPVCVQVQQRDVRHDLRAEADSGEVQRTEHGSLCSFCRPDNGL